MRIIEMLRKTVKNPKTVSEKVHELLARPNDSDSEETSDVDVATAPRVVDFAPDEYDFPDARTTDFRKRNVKLLSEQSERYKGKIATRKQLEDEDDETESENNENNSDDESSSDDEDDTALEEFNTKLQSGSGDPNNQIDSDVDMDDDGDGDDDADGDSEEDEIGSDEDDEDDEFGDDDDDDDDAESSDDKKQADIMTKANHKAEIQKGICVQNQLLIWEKLLEVRINSHKVISKANQLPSPETLSTLSSDNEELKTVLKEAQERSIKMLQQLFALQSALTQQHSELKQSVKRKLLSEGESANESTTCKRFAGVLQNNFEQMRGYRDDVILKWDDRTKLLTPGAGTKRKSLQEEEYNVIKKIASALSNREALIQKSQTLKAAAKKEEGGGDGENNVQQATHIYDDSDFYHQQLRELIEYKASTSSNMSEITKQFVELQKLRQKMKKKVDTRASKGRKLRYVVHTKLINFMAPNETSEWTDGSKAELYKSLFI